MPQEHRPDFNKHITLSELHHDVWHENFVPKYSSLASAKPSLLILIGVWLIFAPGAILSIAFGLSSLSESRNVVPTILSSIDSVFFFVLAVAVLTMQTRRYWNAKYHTEDESDERTNAMLANDLTKP